ncbi:MAG: tetratricopeptide repeat protein [bacterium]|nr:tetratricopeptide repeat protein [bacterium]
MERVTRINMLIDMLKKESEDEFLNYALALEYATDLNSAGEAEHLFKKVIHKNEDYIAAYYQLGKLLESTLRKNEALDAYKRGLDKATLKKDHKAINELGEAIFLLED